MVSLEESHMPAVYTESEVQAWLDANLPSWILQDGHLTRTFVTRSWQLTLLLANAIGFLAEAAWHHPELTLTYPRLIVRLQTHEAGGITDRDFELARRIEQAATWQPADSDALTGNPNRWVR